MKRKMEKGRPLRGDQRGTWALHGVLLACETEKMRFAEAASLTT